MRRLIDGGALKKQGWRLCRTVHGVDTSTYETKDIEDVPIVPFIDISALPIVDNYEIVRCKDCIHKPTGSGVNHDIEFPEQDYRCPCRCEDYWYSWIPDDNWFCANGERRKDETEPGIYKTDMEEQL